MASIRQNLKVISDQIQKAYADATVFERAAKPPRLVAVSKTKPKELIIEAYREGQRHFGENYVQELVEKSNDPDILKFCPEIQWHFIGNCQSSNVPRLVRAERLDVIETITSEKLADRIQARLTAIDKGLKQPVVKVMVQVNTSGEENKNGLEPENVLKVVKHLVEHCCNLKFIGLMTIGELGRSLQAKVHGSAKNPDFLKLIDCRREVAKALTMDEQDIELSMGMSNDFEEAIRMGSTNVRIGSSIFGKRAYPTRSPGSAGDGSADKLANDLASAKIDHK